MTRLITAREAIVKTATIEVKALTISGRQVTLSVFRQLKDEDLLDEGSADLRGVPWGIVNYFFGDCLKASTHLHVVWQLGDELRRACVYDRPTASQGYRQRQSRLSRVAGGWITALTLAGRSPSHVTYRGQKDTECWANCTIGDYEVNPVIPWQAWQLQTWEQNRPWTTFKEDDWADAPETVALKQVMDAAQAEVDRRKARYEQRWGLFKHYPLPAHGSDERRAYAAVQAAEQERQEADRAHHESMKNSYLAAEKEHRLTELRQHFGEEPTDPVVYWKAVTTAKEELDRFIQAWHDQYAALENLDHLFIAV